MRQYAWYSPDLDVIVLQTIIEDRFISFEWNYSDMVQVMTENGEFNSEINPIDKGFWIPLGEI